MSEERFYAFVKCVSVLGAVLGIGAMTFVVLLIIWGLASWVVGQ